MLGQKLIRKRALREQKAEDNARMEQIKAEKTMAALDKLSVFFGGSKRANTTKAKSNMWD